MTDFLRAPSKKSLLAMLKNVGELTSREWTRFFDGVLFKSEFNKIVGGDDASGSSGGGFSFANFLKRDGTTKLTADWNAGSQKIRAKTLQSDVSTGTAPLTVASTTKVTNLNADLVDGQTGTYYLDSDNFTGTEWTDLTDAGDTTLHGHDVTGLTNWPTIDYSYVSGNDAGTDISAAELEELSDASSTALHTHADIGDGPWLPLSAGSGKALTGNLFLHKTANPTIRLAEGGDASNYGEIVSPDASQLRFIHTRASGDSFIAIDPLPSNGTGKAEVRYFRSTNTTGICQFVFYVGDGTNTVQHIFRANSGQVDICQQGGNATVGGAGGSEKLTVIGTASFGDGGTTDYTEFEADGTIKFNGAATVFDDLRTPALSVKVPASGNPGFSQFKNNGSASTGVFLYWFSPTSEEEVYFVTQLPHNYKEGSNIVPHVHWVPADTAAGAGTDVSWGLEYTWANRDAVFGNATIIYADEQSIGPGETLTEGKHYKTFFSAISGTGKEISSMLVCRLFRDATGTGGTDDYDDDAGFLEIDFHYEIDTVGSRTVLVK